MSKNKTDDFLSKFANRVEKVGRDGVMGLMKSTGLPINSVRQGYLGTPDYSFSMRKNGPNEIDKNTLDFDNSALKAKNQNSLYFNNNNTYRNKSSMMNNIIPNMNHYSNMNKNNDYKLHSAKTILPEINYMQNKRNMNDQYQNMNNNNNNIRNPLMFSSDKINNQKNSYNDNTHNNRNYFNSRSNIRSNSLNYRYYNNNNNDNLFESQQNNALGQRNIYSVANNRQNIVDYGYTPYTLKDYKKITNDVKLGKLGPNIGTEEWNKKRKKMKKMSEYGNKVMHEGKGCYVKLAESADERHKRLQEMKQLNGKWNIINEYSRGLMFNNDRNSNEQFKRNVNNKLMEEERLVDQQFELDMEKEEEEERILQQKKNAIYQQRLNRMKNLLFN